MAQRLMQCRSLPDHDAQTLLIYQVGGEGLTLAPGQGDVQLLLFEHDELLIGGGLDEGDAEILPPGAQALPQPGTG